MPNVLYALDDNGNAVPLRVNSDGQLIVAGISDGSEGTDNSSIGFDADTDRITFADGSTLSIPWNTGNLLYEWVRIKSGVNYDSVNEEFLILPTAGRYLANIDVIFYDGKTAPYSISVGIEIAADYQINNWVNITAPPGQILHVMSRVFECVADSTVEVMVSPPFGGVGLTVQLAVNIQYLGPATGVV